MIGYEGLRETAAWVDVSSRGVIRLTGDDRARLLHAMSTNSVNGLQTGQGCYAFFLNSQGRILCDAHIYVFAESILLDTEAETAQKLFDHLDKYIIADDVLLENESGEWTILDLGGPESCRVAADLNLRVPNQKDSSELWALGFAARVSSSTNEGVRLFVPRAVRETLIEQLTQLQVPEATPAEAHTVRLENKLPRYGEDITERYLVQETQAMHAVHSNKGCYLGQEIVERVRSRAQIHRLLTAIWIESETPPKPGTKLSSEGGTAGEITSAAYSPAIGKVVALAYLKTDLAARKTELLVENAEATVRASIT